MKSYIKVITTILLFLSTLSLRAQTDSVRGRTTSSLTLASALLDPITLPASLDQDVERLLERWYSGYGQHKGVRGSTRYTPSSVTIPYTPDSVYIRMLNKMPSAMRFSYNPLVREAIELYLFRRRGLLSSMLSLADLYFPEIEVTLDKNALPMELRYLVIVESALNPKAISPAGAAGLWQLMLPTGKIYGLSVNSLVDERMDPVKSTEAACRFLKDLYRIYGDWWLVLAAYNCGPGNVNRALRRTGMEKPNFWEIYRYLPNETRRYIPLFIGAYFAMHYHREYGIVPRELGRPLATEYYTASHRVTFDRISELTGVDTETISAFNPQFRRGIIPGNNQPYPVRLPLSAIIKLDSLSEEVSSPELRVNLEGPSSSTVGKKSQKESTEGVEEAASTTKTKKRDRASKRDRQSRKAKANGHSTHKVRSGETLYSIAHKYGVSVSELKRANGLKSDRLSVGQSISVHKK
ncbi:lytic transglycosylase domain-containing protein [Porphyromonas catoniae]|uniref:lytic transglycosylase domain-containing protein n=1 Tax=Porphyromonas catoniae TaxID=41976 RepID=UPI0023F4BD6B|nr:lytic transglycosylase domain-containing protein [Porphyromonas catoniae]